MTDKVERQPQTNAARADLDEDTKRALDAADAVILSMNESFIAESQRLSHAMESAISACSDPGTDVFERQIFLEDAFQASHELRGQAGMFGYGLLTELCQSLCALIEIEQTRRDDDTSNAEKDIWDAIRNHTTIVCSIVKKDIKGDGGELGMALKSEVSRLRLHVNSLAA